VDWFSPYEIKVEFQNKGNCIAYRHAVYDICFSPDGKYLAIAGGQTRRMV